MNFNYFYKNFSKSFFARRFFEFQKLSKIRCKSSRFLVAINNLGKRIGSIGEKNHVLLAPLTRKVQTMKKEDDFNKWYSLSNFQGFGNLKAIKPER